MGKVMRVFGVILLSSLPSVTVAADPGFVARRNSAVVCARAPAYVSSRSHHELLREVGDKYHQAVHDSEVSHTVYSRSERITWALAARAACGKAWGHLSAGEIEPDQLRQCGCAYDNMMNQGHISVRY